MKAVILTNNSGAEIQFPCSRVQMTGALSYLGLNETSPYELPGNGKSDVDCEVRLSPQSQIDEWLLPYTKDASLELLNSVYEQLGRIPAPAIEILRKVGNGYQ